MEPSYMKGKRQGVMIKYYKDGSKSSETPYVDGNANGTEIKYRRNGSKEMETVYVKHSKQSEVWYREDGSKWKEMPYKGHVLHGTAVSYQKDGSIKQETPWVNGKINGMQIGYREDGSKAMETLYENGKEISRKELWPATLLFSSNQKIGKFIQIIEPQNNLSANNENGYQFKRPCQCANSWVSHGKDWRMLNECTKISEGFVSGNLANECFNPLKTQTAPKLSKSF